MASCGVFGRTVLTAQPTRTIQAVQYRQKKNQEVKFDDGDSDVSMSSCSTTREQSPRGGGRAHGDLVSSGVPQETARELLQIGHLLAGSQFHGHKLRVKNYDEGWTHFLKKIACAIEEQYGRDDVSVVAASLKKFMTHALNAEPPADRARANSAPESHGPKRRHSQTPTDRRRSQTPTERRLSPNRAPLLTVGQLNVTTPTHEARLEPTGIPESPKEALSCRPRGQSTEGDVNPSPPTEVESTAKPESRFNVPGCFEPAVWALGGTTTERAPDNSDYADCYPSADPGQSGGSPVIPPFFQGEFGESLGPASESLERKENDADSMAAAPATTNDERDGAAFALPPAQRVFSVELVSSPETATLATIATETLSSAKVDNFGDVSEAPKSPQTDLETCPDPSLEDVINRARNAVPEPNGQGTEQPGAMPSPPTNAKPVQQPGLPARYAQQPVARKGRKKKAALKSIGPKWMDQCKMPTRSREQMIHVAKTDPNAKRVLMKEWGRNRREINELLEWAKNPNAKKAKHKRSSSTPTSMFDYSAKPKSTRDRSKSNAAKRWEERRAAKKAEAKAETQTRSRAVYNVQSIFDAPGTKKAKASSRKTKAQAKRWEERVKAKKEERKNEDETRARKVYSEPSIFDSPAAKTTAPKASSKTKAQARRWEERVQAQKRAKEDRRAQQTSEAPVTPVKNAKIEKAKAQAKRWEDRVKAAKEERKSLSSEELSEDIFNSGPFMGAALIVRENSTGGSWDQIEKKLLIPYATAKLGGQAPSQAQLDSFWETATEKVQDWLKQALKWHDDEDPEARQLFVEQAPQELQNWLESFESGPEAPILNF